MSIDLWFVGVLVLSLLALGATVHLGRVIAATERELDAMIRQQRALAAAGPRLSDEQASTFVRLGADLAKTQMRADELLRHATGLKEDRERCPIVAEPAPAPIPFSTRGRS